MSRLLLLISMILVFSVATKSVVAVLASNQAFSEQHTLETVQAEIKQLKREIAILDNKIASQKSTLNDEIRTMDLEAAGYVPIGERIQVPDTLASL